MTDSLYLFHLCQIIFLGFVLFFVEQGVDIHACDDQAIIDASESGHLEVAKYLADKGANICVGKDEPLRWAAGNDHLEVVKYLLDCIGASARKAY